MDPTCFKCGEPFFEGLCVWCTCEQCGNKIHDGVCLFCNTPEYVRNTIFQNVTDYYPTPPPSPFTCFNCGNPSDEGLPCGQCFCTQCGYANCICYAPSIETSYACDTSFDNYPQNDFNHPFQNFYEQVQYFNGDSSNFENCGGSFENFYEPNSCYDGFNQPPQNSDFANNMCEIKSMIEELKELVANCYTPEPHEKTIEDRASNPFKNFVYYDSDDDDEEITFKTSDVSPIVPDDSLKMGDEHLNTIPATESDIFNKSSVENLVPIPSESGEISNGDIVSDPSFTPVERSDVVLDEIEACLANNDSNSTMVDDSNFDPDEDIRVLEELLNEEPSISLLPINNEDFDEVESYSDSHNEYTTSDEDSCGDIDDNDVEEDVEIQDEILREKLLKINLLISKIEALNDPPTFSPIPVMDSDFLPELEMFRFEEKNSGNPTIHAFSLPDYELFDFEIDFELISDNPSRDPLLEDVDPFLATDDLIPPGIENDEYDVQGNILFDLFSSRPPAKPPDVNFDSNTFGVVDDISEQDVPVLDILPTQPTRDSDIEFALTIWVFQPFFTYPISSPYFHSTGSEDTVFDPGISVYGAGCPLLCFPKDE